jgi:hypothetical protein
MCNDGWTVKGVLSYFSERPSRRLWQGLAQQRQRQPLG